MLSDAIKQLKTALLLLAILSLLTGLIYPGLVTVCAQLFFPNTANGSLIEINNQLIGSQLIGQSFRDPKYFWGRPSATSPYPYNASASSGSNLGPSNPDYLNLVQDRIKALHKADPNNTLPVPIDLVTASGSGLDPEISPLAAMYQASRIAAARKLPESEIEMLIMDHIKLRTFKILGEPRVNVLKLNIALDHLQMQKRP